MKKRNLKILKIFLIVILVSVVFYVALGVVKNKQLNKQLYSPEDTSTPEPATSPGLETCYSTEDCDDYDSCTTDLCVYGFNNEECGVVRPVPAIECWCQHDKIDGC